ncbi:hypothetical protein Tco_0541197 [Tanacetum coccineum]
MQIVMENPNHLNEPNEAIPEVNPVVPELNHVKDAHDPNEMVDITDDEELVDYDGDNEEAPKEEPEEEPKPNNGHGNQFTQHPNPQPGNMNGWLEEDDDMNENVNNEDIVDEDVEIEVDDDAELIFPYEVEGDQTPPPRDESFDSEPPNAESSDSVSSDFESEDEEIDVAPKVDVAPSGLAPWALRRDLETSYARARLIEAKLCTNQTKIALLKSKDKIREKEREILNHDLGEMFERDSFRSMLPKSTVEARSCAESSVRVELGGAGAGGARAGGAKAGGARAGSARPAALEITRCTYVTFMKCDPQPFKGTIRCYGDTMCTLTWWNGMIASMGIDAVNGTSWTEVRKWMTECVAKAGARIVQLEVKRD